MSLERGFLLLAPRPWQQPAYPRVAQNPTGARAARALLESPNHNPAALSSTDPHAPWATLCMDTGSRNNDLKDSVSSKRLRVKGQGCFHPANACFHPNLSQITHQMEKKNPRKVHYTRQLYFTIHLLQVNQSQARERNSSREHFRNLKMSSAPTWLHLPSPTSGTTPAPAPSAHRVRTLFQSPPLIRGLIPLPAPNCPCGNA